MSRELLCPEQLRANLSANTGLGVGTPGLLASTLDSVPLGKSLTSLDLSFFTGKNEHGLDQSWGPET